MFLLKSLYMFIKIIKYINFILFPALIGLTCGLCAFAGDSAKSVWDFSLIFCVAILVFLIISIFCILTFKTTKNLKAYIENKNTFKNFFSIFILWLSLFILIYSFAQLWGLGIVAIYSFFPFYIN